MNSNFFDIMDNCCAPQWADFTRSPQVCCDSYFEKEHEVHDPQILLKSTINSTSSFSYMQESKNEQSVNETKFDDSLESETSAHCNIVYFIPHENKKHSVEKIKEDHQLDRAMNDLKLDERSSKIHQTWNISITDLTTEFKVSMANHKIKKALPERIKQRMLKTKTTVLGKSSLKDIQGNDMEKKNALQTAFAKNKDKLVTKSKVDTSAKDNLSEKRLSYKIASLSKKESNLFNKKRHSLGKSQPKVLTCQYRITRMIKNRKRSNQFVSLAEAISKFQNGTPQRFRTLSNKDMKPGPLMKLKRSPLKLTYPVSPALRCKQRRRRGNILSQQEREELEVEEMKKHQIKANPVPINILKGPSVLKKVPKKPTTVTEEFHLTQSKRTRHTAGPSLNLQQNTNATEHKKVVPITHSTSSSSISSKKENPCVEVVADNTKDTKFNSNTRNKEFQMRKDEKLKNLHTQEVNKVKTEFHARPAPKFLKPTNTVKEQSSKRRTIATCPFSFEERNKFLAKKKEEFIKQLEEQDKKVRVFHANPVPNFKPVVIHGLSKDNIRSKDKVCGSKELGNRQIKSYRNQENKQPNIMNNTLTDISTRKKEIINRTSTSLIDTKNKKLNNVQNKVDKVELNTMKRVQKRNEFDDKIKKREQEFGAKKMQEEKNKLLKEKMERAELRKMAEVKARPMPIYKPINIVKSTKPITNPQSPALGIRNKAKAVS
ncbi:targeting protein for Xklp2-like [Bombus pyrosoma]|uniref:targeting protein for Xklp2-like n=1 Tax=Bombus pyrosoma TaxID=396416 RepID=UPI001CB9B1DF|nr:targeting protein for Xklp2-like [Bombus pyrosoma]XP_043602922.1 targeting protein for Xklp2-like [Bombus pyrosoma]XP_043602923.1 targeting protein for Xklp2-like [Bombus pyrosoma]XP_043602924.1 targeting protein for Xklp2-like [Bombus pyrosoma]